MDNFAPRRPVTLREIEMNFYFIFVKKKKIEKKREEKQRKRKERKKEKEKRTGKRIKREGETVTWHRRRFSGK